MDAASIYALRKLMERIDAKQAEMTRPLLLGNASDFADYKKRAGYLAGLADVEHWIQEISLEDEERGA